MEIKGLKIHFTDQQKAKILDEVKDILDSGQLASGKYVQSFEQNWSKLNNCKHGIAVSSGGAALEVLFRSLNLKGKEVIVPTNTFIATYNSAMFAGAKPVLADVSYKNMCLDLEILPNVRARYVLCIFLILKSEVNNCAYSLVLAIIKTPEVSLSSL